MAVKESVYNQEQASQEIKYNNTGMVFTSGKQGPIIIIVIVVVIIILLLINTNEGKISCTNSFNGFMRLVL